MLSNIMVTRSSEYALHGHAVDEMFRFRAEIFCNRLQWQLQVIDGLEKDQYDALNPVYLLSRTAHSDIESCARLLPTTGRYMLDEVFSEMLQGEMPPCSESIWELSRFAVTPATSTSALQASFHPITLRMMQGLVDFADENGISSYVVVTSVALERLLRRIGLSVQRLGRGEAMHIGGVLSVACWLNVNEQSRRAIQEGLGVISAQKEAA